MKAVMNHSFKHVSFDLDGTIVDSFYTIYKSTVGALKVLNIKQILAEHEFRKRIGYHFIDIFKELNIPVKDFEEFINIYKDLYFDYIGEASLYPGAEEVLSFLNEKHIAVSLLTTKGQGQADKNIDHFGLRKYFSFVMGRRDGIANKPSPEPLLYICNQLNIKPGETIFIGDTEVDMRCGKDAGAITCAAIYGYGGKEKLSAEKPDYTVSEISELKRIIG